ncbi:MAG: family 20 glycosylhydrolase [Bacteroidia bacterium]|nr:family 20 glycosylhydrolase [Bacteroidia bacterium]
MIKYFLLLIAVAYFQLLQAQIQFIPEPQQVTYQAGTFSLPNPSTYAFNSTDSFAFSLLRAHSFFVSTELVETSFKKQAVLYCQLVDSKKWKRELKKFLLDTTFMADSEGYVLQITPNQIRILAQTDAGLFYAIQTLLQISNNKTAATQLPCLTIYDVPAFPIRAWQDDISRGPIPTMEFLKEEIKTLSAYKLNYFTLYTENIFKYNSHPDMAPDDGISKEEIEELISYAAQYHVTLIGNQQSFGHMEKILANPAYQALGERQHILSPANEGSYLLLKDMFKEMAPAYTCKYFNINCDETFGLGEGQSKQLVDSIGLPNVYANHINRLIQLLKPYDKRIIMWADIVGNHPEIISQLPNDLILIPWSYTDLDNFDKILEPIAASGLDFWVAPGVSCWSNIYPNTNVAKKNIFNLVRDGKKFGAKGVLNTTWDDDGSNFFTNNWQGLIWGAALSWNAPLVKESGSLSQIELDQKWNAFNRAYDKLFWGTKSISISKIQNEFADIHQNKIKGLLKNQRLFEFVFPLNSDNLKEEQKVEYKSIEDKINTLLIDLIVVSGNVNSHSECIPYLQFAMEESLFIIQMNEFRNKLNDYLQYYLNAATLKEDLNRLVLKLNQLSLTYAELYRLENRNWWLKENLLKFEKLRVDLDKLPGTCIIVPDTVLTNRKRKITLRSLIYNLPIYYTINGTDPNAKSGLYTKPFFLNKTAIVKATMFWGKDFTYTQDSFIMHKAIGKLKQLNSIYSNSQPSFNGGGKWGLVDGRIGSNNLKSGKWQGYDGQDLNLILDFVKDTKLKTFRMGFYQYTRAWVILPKSIDLYTSADGVNFNLLISVSHTIDPNSDQKIIHYFEANLNKVKTRYLKIIARSYGKLPAWHASAGKDSMLFSDEIIVK